MNQLHDPNYPLPRWVVTRKLGQPAEMWRVLGLHPGGLWVTRPGALVGIYHQLHVVSAQEVVGLCALREDAEEWLMRIAADRGLQDHELEDVAQGAAAF